MTKSDSVTDFMFDIVDAVRAKKEITDKINPQDFASKIASLEEKENMKKI